MDNKKNILAFLAMKRYSTPYTEKDLIEAIEFGKNLLTEEIKYAMIGMSVNGVCQSVLTEDKLQEILK